MPGEGRHLATVLFLDIVGSTSIAEELGDEGWRSLLSRFRGAVRHELRRFGGHEVDTAGDGFFATFPDPTSALRAASAIANAVQDIGLDIHAGVHAGEVESDGKHVSGVTVHIGARVMALADPAQILVTSTVRDMERGAPGTFVGAGEHTLKGVEGTWQLFSLRDLDGQSPPAPLASESATERRRAVLETPHRRRPQLVVAFVVLVALVATVVVASRPHDESPPPVATRPVMLKIDLASQAIEGAVNIPTVEGSPYWAPGNLAGDILRFSPNAGEVRDMSTGHLQETFPIPSWQWVSVGDGYGWVDSLAGYAEPRLLRVDDRTGKITKRSSGAGGLWNMWWGPGGGWSFTSSDLGDSLIAEVDPITLDVRTWRLPLGDWMLAVPRSDGVWAAAQAGTDVQLAWFDLRTHRSHEVQVPAGSKLVVDGPDAYNPRGAFLLDPETEVLTPLGAGRLEPSNAIGVVDAPRQLLEPRKPILFASTVRDTLWIAAYGVRDTGSRSGSVESVVVGVPRRSTGSPAMVIPLPAGFEAQHTLADESENALWVGSCYCGTAY